MSDSPNSVMQNRIKSNTLSYHPEDKGYDPSIDPADYTLVTMQIAARLLGVSHTTLWLWRRRGKGPRSIKVGKQQIRYRLADLKDWVETKDKSSAPSIDPTDDVLVTSKVAARLLNISDFVICSWRRDGNGPHFIKIDKRRVRYRLADIKDWLETNARTTID